MKALSIENRGALAARLDWLGITQKQLASDCGISEVHLSNILTGKSGPSQELFERLAEAIGFEVDVRLVPKD